MDHTSCPQLRNWNIHTQFTLTNTHTTWTGIQNFGKTFPSRNVHYICHQQHIHPQPAQSNYFQEQTIKILRDLYMHTYRPRALRKSKEKNSLIGCPSRKWMLWRASPCLALRLSSQYLIMLCRSCDTEKNRLQSIIMFTKMYNPMRCLNEMNDSFF